MRNTDMDTMQINAKRDKILYDRVRKVAKITYRSIASCVREAVDMWLAKEEVRLAKR